GRLTLHGLTIQNGAVVQAAGGAIFNRGALTVSQTVIRDSIAALVGQGGGIYSIGTLRFVDSRVTSNRIDSGGGGVIYSEGSLHVLRSTIDNNRGAVLGTSFGGGGIFASGTVTIKDSAIADNSSNSVTGDLGGGGLFVFSLSFPRPNTTVTITNTTIAHNN